jgi:hypothetical protein
MGVIDFVKNAFSDGGSPSAARVMLLPHCLAAVFVLVYVAIKTHTFPDGTAAAGLGAFATAPYAVSKASNMFSYQKKDIDVDTSSSKTTDNKGA